MSSSGQVVEESLDCLYNSLPLLVLVYRAGNGCKPHGVSGHHGRHRCCLGSGSSRAACVVKCLATSFSLPETAFSLVLSDGRLDPEKACLGAQGGQLARHEPTMTSFAAQVRLPASPNKEHSG